MGHGWELFCADELDERECQMQVMKKELDPLPSRLVVSLVVVMLPLRACGDASGLAGMHL